MKNVKSVENFIKNYIQHFFFLSHSLARRQRWEKHFFRLKMLSRGIFFSERLRKKRNSWSSGVVMVVWQHSFSWENDFMRTWREDLKMYFCMNDSKEWVKSHVEFINILKWQNFKKNPQKSQAFKRNKISFAFLVKKYCSSRRAQEGWPFA